MLSSATTKDGTAGMRKGRNRHFSDDIAGDDIMLIPDLDDEDAEVRKGGGKRSKQSHIYFLFN